MTTRFLTRQFDVTPAELRRAIRQLTPPQRDAIMYCYFLGFTQERASLTLGITQQAVSKHLHCAMVILRKKFEWSGCETA